MRHTVRASIVVAATASAFVALGVAQERSGDNVARAECTYIIDGMGGMYPVCWPDGGGGGGGGGGAGGGGGGGGGGGQSWEQRIDQACADDAGNEDLATQLEDLVDPVNSPDATAGSERLVHWVRTCDVTFNAELDPMLGRPAADVEHAIVDPANSITANQAQLDAVRAHLDELWAATAQCTASAPPTTAAPPESTSADAATPARSDPCEVFNAPPTTAAP